MTSASPTARYGQIDPDYGTKLATTPPEDDGPIWMVNLMSYRDRAEYADGRETTLTGREADDAYAPLGPLAAIGAEVVFFADVDEQFLGDAPRWDRVGVVKYPSRRAFIDMQSRPDFQALHAHKDAGMAQTIIVGCLPIPGPEIPADASDLADVPHPSTPEDPAVVMLHVLRYHDGQEDEMETYQQFAGSIAIPHGVRIAGWFDAEGTIIGDGRTWDQLRFNAFPSKAAFMAVALDPERLRMQAEHRETAIADTYSLLLRPMIDRLAESIA